MRILLLGSMLLLSGCESGTLFPALTGPTLVTEEQSSPGSRAYSSQDGNVPKFHAAYEKCSARGANSARALDMEAARAAAAASETRVVVDMSQTARGRQATASFDACMTRAGYAMVQ